MLNRNKIAHGILGAGHVLARHQRLSRLGRAVAWYSMCGFSNASNYDMDRNGERWLIERYAPSLATRSVIDVGANMGDWSARVLAISPTTKIYAVDMVPSFASKLRERFRATATIVEAALSDRAESATGYRVGNGGRIPRVTSPKKAEPFELHTLTGDDLVADLGLKDIAAIKIDVDGYDIKVLRGFATVIAEQRPIVQFEYSRFYIYTRSFLKDAYDFFEPLDYRIGRLMPSWIEFSEYDRSMEIFATNNYVAIPVNRPQ